MTKKACRKGQAVRRSLTYHQTYRSCSRGGK